MVRDRPLQDVDHARPTLVIVERSEDATGFDGHHPHPQFESPHALDFRAEVDRRQQIHRDPFRLVGRIINVHPRLLPCVMAHR